MLWFYSFSFRSHVDRDDDNVTTSLNIDQGLGEYMKVFDLKGNIPRISSYTWLFAKNTG